jgi:hypothetical protein
MKIESIYFQTHTSQKSVSNPIRVQCCELGGLVIIHKRTYPNLARGSEEKVELFSNLYVLATRKNPWSKHGEFNFFFLHEIWQLWAILSPKDPF